MFYTPLLERIFPFAVFRYPSPSQKRIFLTFDDGPDPATTKPILDVLAKHSAKATFFVVGSQVEKYPELAREMRDLGHSIQNHSYSHTKRIFMKAEEQHKEIENAQQTFIDELGLRPIYYRPPFGRFFPGIRNSMSSLNLELLMWDILTRDYQTGRTARQIVQVVRRWTRNGSVILMHDRSNNVAETQKALPEIIAFLVDSGYQLSTL